jgi:hypothetical protein
VTFATGDHFYPPGSDDPVTLRAQPIAKRARVYLSTFASNCYQRITQRWVAGGLFRKLCGG